MGIITKLDRTGHSTLAEWKKDDKIQIRTAEEVFSDLQKTGHALADISDPAESKFITKFDPEATEITAVPQLQAG